MTFAISFWDLFWVLFIFLPLVFLWAFGLIDVFRRQDLSGIAKAIWVILILWIPIIGLLIYFLSRPSEPPIKSEYYGGTSHAASDFSVADELNKLSALHDQGKISDEEWEVQKTRLLGSGRY